MKNELLSKNIMNDYDYVTIRNLIENIFELFNYIELMDDKIPLPRITANYKVKYNQFVPTTTSAIENFTMNEFKAQIKKENTRKRLLSKVTLSLKKLNYIELQVFKFSYYEKETEENIIDKIHYGKDKLREIKKSASLKFLISLGVDYLCIKGGDKLKA